MERVVLSILDGEALAVFLFFMWLLVLTYHYNPFSPHR